MYKPIDQDGNKMTIGTTVCILIAPDELISGLPESDQSAIKAVEGKKLIIEDFDKYGHAELRFRDKNNHIHYIWVRPSALQVVSHARKRIKRQVRRKSS